jgi:opacity protein-like surface antigen
MELDKRHCAPHSHRTGLASILRVAHALCDSIALKAEALWFDLGNVSLRATNPNFDGALDVDQKVEGVVARAGVGYKF